MATKDGGKDPIADEAARDASASIAKVRDISPLPSSPSPLLFPLPSSTSTSSSPPPPPFPNYPPPTISIPEYPDTKGYELEKTACSRHQLRLFRMSRRRSLPVS